MEVVWEGEGERGEGEGGTIFNRRPTYTRQLKTPVAFTNVSGGMVRLK